MTHTRVVYSHRSCEGYVTTTISLYVVHKLNSVCTVPYYFILFVFMITDSQVCTRMSGKTYAIVTGSSTGK